MPVVPEPRPHSNACLSGSRERNWGVYVLYLRGEVVYYGAAQFLGKRRWQQEGSHRKHDAYDVIEDGLTKCDAEYLETSLKRQHRDRHGQFPLYNRRRTDVPRAVPSGEPEWDGAELLPIVGGLVGALAAGLLVSVWQSSAPSPGAAPRPAAALRPPPRAPSAARASVAARRGTVDRGRAVHVARSPVDGRSVRVLRLDDMPRGRPAREFESPVDLGAWDALHPFDVPAFDEAPTSPTAALLNTQAHPLAALAADMERQRAEERLLERLAFADLAAAFRGMIEAPEGPWA